MSQQSKRQPVTTIEIERAIASSSGRPTIASALLGISRSALDKRIKNHVRLQRCLIDARENRVDRAEGVIDKCLDAEDLQLALNASKFTLRTQGKHRGWADEGPGSVSLSFTIERISEPRDEQGNILGLPEDVE